MGTTVGAAVGSHSGDSFAKPGVHIGSRAVHHGLSEAVMAPDTDFEASDAVLGLIRRNDPADFKAEDFRPQCPVFDNGVSAARFDRRGEKHRDCIRRRDGDERRRLHRGDRATADDE